MTILLVTGCGESAPAPRPVAHPWVTAPPPAEDGQIALPAWLVHPLALVRRDEAAAELDAEPWVQISPGSASHYTGQPIGVPAELRPFLVRALAPGGVAGDVTVVQRRDGLWIQVPAGSAPLEAAPVVVLLDPTPATIYLTVE